MKMVSTTTPITTKRNTEVAKRCMWMRDKSCPLKRSQICSIHHVLLMIESKHGPNAELFSSGQISIDGILLESIPEIHRPGWVSLQPYPEHGAFWAPPVGYLVPGL